MGVFCFGCNDLVLYGIRELAKHHYEALKTNYYFNCDHSPVRLDLQGEFNCGGSILDERNILTAAHCTEGHKAQDLTAWVGDHNRKVPDGESHHAVCGLTQHPDYEGPPKINKDIAILHLCEPLTFRKGKFDISQFAADSLQV